MTSSSSPTEEMKPNTPSDPTADEIASSDIEIGLNCSLEFLNSQPSTFSNSEKYINRGKKVSNKENYDKNQNLNLKNEDEFRSRINRAKNFINNEWKRIEIDEQKLMLNAKMQNEVEKLSKAPTCSIRRRLFNLGML